jgi:transmembrane sensor
MASRQPTPPESVEVARKLGWMQREVFFEDTPLYEILYQVERWYDVRFVLEDSSVARERLNMHIQNESITDVLGLLRTLTDLEYRRSGRAIHLSR